MIDEDGTEGSNTRYTDGKDIQGGSVTQVFGTAWPIVVGMLSYTAMGVADTLMVGWIGTTELAAVGLATALFHLFNGFFTGVLHGIKIVVAQATGAGRHTRAIAATWVGVALGVLMGLVMAASPLAGPWMLDLMGAQGAVLTGALAYFSIRALSAPAWYAFTAFSEYLQGVGDTVTPMKMTVAANLLNIALDAVLIFGLGPFPALGVAGAAWATTISCALAMVAMVAYFLRHVSARPTYEPGLLGEVWRLGVPIGIRYGLDNGAFTTFTALVARMGEDALAANQIVLQIASLSFLPGHGISEAVCILTGQHYGAGDEGALERSARSGLMLGVGVMGALGVLFVIAPGALLSVFDPTDEVAAIGVQLLYVAAIFQVFDAVTMILSGALNGVGDTRFTLALSLTGWWFVLVPTAYLLGVHLGYGAPGAWMGFTVQLVVMSAVGAWRFFGGGWRRANPSYHLQSRDVRD